MFAKVCNYLTNIFKSTDKYVEHMEDEANEEINEDLNNIKLYFENAIYTSIHEYEKYSFPLDKGYKIVDLSTAKKLNECLKKSFQSTIYNYYVFLCNSKMMNNICDYNSERIISKLYDDYMELYTNSLESEEKYSELCSELVKIFETYYKKPIRDVTLMLTESANCNKIKMKVNHLICKMYKNESSKRHYKDLLEILTLAKEKNVKLNITTALDKAKIIN